MRAGVFKMRTNGVIDKKKEKKKKSRTDTKQIWESTTVYGEVLQKGPVKSDTGGVKIASGRTVSGSEPFFGWQMRYVSFSKAADNPVRPPRTSVCRTLC